ncbi:MAG: flagellar filament capping protein FliD [Oxalobacteraceae bacterium]|jgi:flagellar hook-associated protein 2|nr:flagellar filament capping protein FliD [Oxalobacteraceae bacterium]
MATSTVSSTATPSYTTSNGMSAEQQAQATNKANAQAVLTSLNAGSGVNVASLAQSLVDAEGNPQKTLINAKITKNESKISGLSAVMFMMSELKTKLTALKDRDGFNTVNASNSNTSALTVTASPAASIGSHQIQINSVSAAQSSISSGFASKTTKLNGGSPFNLTIAQTNKAGVSAGTGIANNTNSASINGVSFGTKPATDDFSNFLISVDGKTIEFTPNPASTSLADLAADLQTQLRANDGGTSDLSVTVSNGNQLDITSATPSRVISSLSLTSAAASMGSPTSTNSSFAVISDVRFANNPSVTDFKNFAVTIDGKNFSITPKPATATMDDLASSIQSQLRALDGTSELSVSVTNGNRLEITSSKSSRAISAPKLSNEVTINLATGANGGTSNGATITGAAFGTSPNVNDFSTFDISIAGKNLSIIPVPNTPTLAALAENIQSQLRILDNSSDMTVSVASDGSTLQFTSASNRAITNPKLTAKTYADTPEGIASAINASGKGYKAQLVNDGSTRPFKIMITGEVGSTESFSLFSASSTPLSFSNITTAADANLTVNGVNFTRKTNTISDVVTGLTLDLKATTTTPVSTMVSRDSSIIQTKLSDLVTAYNDFNNIITETTNPKSTLDTYGATLVGNSTVRMIKLQMRQLIVGDSSTASGGIKNLSQIGLSINEKGVMTLDAAKASAALNNNYDGVVKALTGGHNNLGTFSTLPAGIAGDAVKKLTRLLAPDGALVNESTGATTQNDKYRASLVKLQTRLDTMLARYNKQFAAMDSLVGNVNAQKTSLKSTFEGMMASYTNK